MRFSDITPLDWEILNALADDYESIEQIQSIIQAGSLTRKDILNRLEYMHQHNYVFLTLNQVFDRQKLEDEIEEKTTDRPYWFGRTENGYLAWSELTDTFYRDRTSASSESPTAPDS